MGAEGDASDSSNGNGVMVRCSNGSKVAVRTSLESTVGAFKALLAQNSDVPADQQSLIYKGRILKDEQTLETYGLMRKHETRKWEPSHNWDSLQVAA